MTTFLQYFCLLTFMLCLTPTMERHRMLEISFSHNPPMFSSSISDLKNLERFELQVVKHLARRVLNVDASWQNTNITIRQMIHAYLEDFYESNGYADAIDAIEKEHVRASKNPLCAFRLIWRVAVLLKEIVSQRGCLQHFGLLCKQIVDFFLQYRWPGTQDLGDLAERILRIQHTYSLDAENLSNGWIRDLGTNCTLNSIHCYEIGIVAVKTDQFASAIEWLELAKEKAYLDQKSSIPITQFSIWTSIEKHNRYFNEGKMLELEPLFFDRNIRHEPQDRKNARKLRDLKYEVLKGSKDPRHANINYLGMCSGSNHQTEEEKSRLFCWHEFKIHSSFAIGPIKMEFLSRNPDILQIYEVLSGDEIRGFISHCDPLIQPRNFKVVSYQLAPQLDRSVSTSYRDSLIFTWCKFSEKDLEGRIERMTSLNLKEGAAEDFLFLSYSVGGHVNAHWDRNPGYRPNSTENTFRIATLTFYLNDVEMGGGTTFTSVGVTARPVKGSAVLWYNHFSDGAEDYALYHGGCPVVLGEKWSNAFNEAVVASPDLVHVFDESCKINTCIIL